MGHFGNFEWVLIWDTEFDRDKLYSVINIFISILKQQGYDILYNKIHILNFIYYFVFIALFYH